MRIPLAFLLLTSLLMGGALSAQPSTYRIAPTPDSRFELIVKKTGVMSGKQHLFVFSRFSGELKMDPVSPAQATLLLHIDATSIECKDDWVNEKDRAKILKEATDKMLRTNAHKEMLFRSTSVEVHNAEAFAVRGELSIRGLAKPVVVTVKGKPSASDTVFEGDAAIDMTAWGLNPPSALLGAIGTNKTMLLRFRVHAVP